MPVPASVMQLLETQNVDYQIATAREDATSNAADLQHMSAAKSMILQDDQGRVQVVISATSLLDIEAVNQTLSRQFRPTTTGELQSFFEKYHLLSIPALPSLAGLPTLIDQRLLEMDLLYLDAGSSDELVELNQAAFRTLIGDAQIANISVPLVELEKTSQTTDADDIFTAVRNFTNLRIKQRLEETLELPPLPETAQRIIKLRVDPNSDISDLANIVETDASLASQVVSWAASPYYSAPGKIKSIHDAIVRVLGFDMVLNLALGLALGKTMAMPKHGAHGVTPYWVQSVYTAAVVEGLVTAIPREHRPGFGMAYLGGLLNNFGYLVLAEVFPPHFQTICRYIEANPHVDPHLIDKQVLGISRDQLSSWLMQLWNMPDEVVVALRQQNNPDYDGEHCEYSLLLLVAQRLLQQKGVISGPWQEIPESVYRRLHLDQEKALLTVSNILDSSDELDVIAQQLAG